MPILKVQRIIITCPSLESEIYTVIGSTVGKAQNVKKTRIYE